MRLFRIVIIGLALTLGACSPAPPTQQTVTARETPTPKVTQGDYSQRHTGWAP
jgi:hypothetical protein